jgi:hypothetical protein
MLIHSPLTRLFALAAVISVAALGQTITGSIVGTVTDPTGASVVNADVTLTFTATGFQRKTKSLASGDFAFNAIDRGNYSLSATSAGFKTSERAGINLTASERLPLGNIVLQVGQNTESVTVKSDPGGGADGEFRTVGRAHLEPGRKPDDQGPERDELTPTAARRVGYQCAGCAGS